MASNIPSFVKKPTRYEDLFKEEELKTPLAATPLSKFQGTSASRDRSTSLPSKRGVQAVTEQPSSGSGSRPGKRIRLPLDKDSPSPSSKVQYFIDMVGNQVPEATVQEWDELDMVQGAREKSLANK